MYHRFLILICDANDSSCKPWVIAMQTDCAQCAKHEYDQLKDKETPAILLDTSDFVTF